MSSPRVLIAGGGGREHAIAHALATGASAPELIAAPGNAGIAALAECVAIPPSDVAALVDLAEARRPDLVVVGPEAPLVRGLADALRARGFAVLGPNAAAARLEGSKAFAKEIMAEAGVPTAQGGHFSDPEAAIQLARALDGRVAVKADGLAAGKGVVVTETIAEAEAAIRGILGGQVGEAGRSVVVEQRLEGEELSVIALCDGRSVALLSPSQDHKRVGEGDTGPNTGGMGAYAPAPRGTDALLEEVEATCLLPVVARLAERGTPLAGVIYAGLMLTESGPRVLEYNVRFGDPEAQVILPLLAEDPYRLFLAAARGDLAGQRRVARRPGAALTVVLAADGYPGTPRTGDPIEGLEAAAAVPDAIVFHSGTRLEGGAVVTAGGRVLSVTGLGADLPSAAKAAYAAADRIRWPGRFCRRDIGWRAL